ncbi:MAG: Hsp20/alpha crystallin family protein [Bacteroidales bacterium]|nr:Hsp20/alpha crystallin family protein [Bacteroidales bacterium]MCM1415800.1 Hsp20/alpha crystallin family protein [bacterium]MCM1422706.1 Hsp20/alpha crystallin family protein [bacterium]
MLRPSLLNNRNYKPAFFDDSFDRMFDDAFHSFWGGNELATFDAFKTDVIDQGDKYLLQAELPGFDKSDINIDLKDDLLTISASHKEEKNEEDKNKYIRRERYYSSYSRSFRVNDVQAGDIDASYNNGILEVSFPKKDLTAKEEVARIEVK